LCLYLKAALAPAENLLVEVDEEVHTVVVTAPDDQLSLAIGRGGQNVRLAAKLTGYHITIQSAAGSVESQVTGTEDYEIDTWEGLEEETREFLVQNKLTTLHDLDRFQNKWIEADEVTTEQRELIEAKVKQFQKEQAERDAERVELK